MRLLRKVFLFCALTVILLMAGGMIYLYFNQDKIIKAVVEEINSIIDVEAKVGNIHLDVFEHWPFIAVQLEQTEIRGANCGINKPLLKTEELSVLLDPLALLRGNFEISRIQASNGQIHIYRSKNCNNYEILKDNGAGSGTFGLKNINLENVHVSYFSNESLQQYEFFAKNMVLDGKIKADQIDASHKGKWEVHLIKSGDFHYEQKELLEIRHKLLYQKESKRLELQDVNASLFETTIKAGLNFDFSQNISQMNFETDKLKIKFIKKFLEKEALDLLEEYKIKGSQSYSIDINGSADGSKLSAEILTKSKDIHAYHPEYQQNIELKESKAHWSIPDLDDWKNSELKISTLKGLNEESDFSLTLDIKNFRRPLIKAQLFSNQKAKFFNKILKLPLEEKIEGDVEIDISYSGILPKKKSAFPANAELSGIITLNDLSFTGKQPEVPVRNLNGQLVLNKNILTIQSLNGYLSKSSFKLDGRIDNTLDYFFSDNAGMYIETKIESDFIDLEEWISDSDDQEDYVLELPDRISQKHDLRIKKMVLDRFSANEIHGKLNIHRGKLKIESMKMNVAGGSISLNMDLDARNNERIEWFTSGHLQNVYIDSVFYIFKNFHQTFIEQRHLEGQIDADFTGFMVSDDHLNFKHEKHIFSIKSRIINGRLIFFEPLQAVSKFIREDDLMNLSFDELENEIFIKDQVINIPKMDISSNVRTISIQGTHTFDNEIDYRLEVPVTAEKEDKDERFGRIKDEKTGKTKLLLKLSGKASDYKVSYDKEALKENVSKGIKDELKELKQTLKKQKEEEEVEIDEDDYFDFN